MSRPWWLILLLLVPALLAGRPAGLAASSPQVSMVREVMPAVVGIGIGPAVAGSTSLERKQRLLEELQRLFERELQELPRKLKPQWQGEGRELTPEDIQVVGSGFLVDKGGTILTAYHVIEEQRQVYVTTHDNKVYRARVVTAAPEDDIGVLAIIDADPAFPVVKLGSSAALEIAEPVIAIGNPFGFTFTVTSGIVSALNRSLGHGVEGLIQTDAPINPGSSGGPLVNMSGEVIGISHAILSPGSRQGEAGFVGLGFAVPIDRAKALLAGERRSARPAAASGGPYLGVRLEAGRDGRPVVVEVMGGSPAAQAGLKPGDGIFAVDGRTDLDVAGVLARIQAHRPGDTLKLQVARGRKILGIVVRLGARS
ncbi:MAG: trypsin-like peptidase domain-containing protein [Thermodesulfobacteriota bacterium]